MHYKFNEASDDIGGLRPSFNESNALIREAYEEMSRSDLSGSLNRAVSSVNDLFGDLVLVDDSLSACDDTALNGAEPPPGSEPVVSDDIVSRLNSLHVTTAEQMQLADSQQVANESHLAYRVKEAREERPVSESLFGLFTGPIVGTQIGVPVQPAENQLNNLLPSRIRTSKF